MRRRLRHVRLGLVLAPLALAAAAGAVSAGEIKDAALVLELTPGTPGSEPEGAPLRFVLLDDGQVFVGGTAFVETGRLEKAEAQELERRADALRKLAGIEAPVAYGGPPDSVARLLLGGKRPLAIVANGWPAEGSARPLPELDALLRELASFDHPSLRPFTPSAYALRARVGRLPGGCRAWSFDFPAADAVRGPRVVEALAAAGWPTGAQPASVCAGEQRYVVTLRPLLPGEQP